MNEAILMENRTYWTHRAPSYSEVNREELATHQHAVWKQVLIEQISARFPDRESDEIHILEIGTGPGFFAILLAEAGYPADALEPRFRCPDCRDTGMADGQRCHCFNARAAELLYSQSGLRRILEHENFDRFSLELYDDQRVITKVGMTERAYMEKQLERCRRYAAGFREKRGNLLFRGNTGVGKSFLSHCIAKELIDQGFAVLYLGAAELFECMAAVSMDREEDLSRKEQYDLIFSADLLIIDDLGTEMMNSLTISQFFNLLNARDVPEKGTVISTNLSLTMLRDTYTERITSRILSGYSIIELYGDDLRRKI